MKKKVFAYLDKWHMLEPGMRILTGFSGGADSTALLQLLWEYGQERKISVCAVHVNHGIRGEEAKRDQQFCEYFCQERAIKSPGHKGSAWKRPVGMCAMKFLKKCYLKKERIG